MRHLGLAAALSLAMAAPAFAQHSSGESTPMGDLMNLNQFVTRGMLNQWSATRPAALAGLSKPSRVWIKAEVQRQAVSPRDPIQVALDVDRVLGKDIKRMAKSERANPDDISGAILLKIMFDTRAALVREAWRAKDVPEPGARPWDVRIAEADIHARNAVDMQSSISLALARD